ncbi:MAG: FGGY family carbohydrate kinase [Ilumatobacteraceae bacterium]
MKTLVIDVGTSGLRSALVHDDGTVSDLHYEAFPPSTPAAGMVEFDASAMYDAVKRVCIASIGSHTIDAVGITNQRASTIVWNSSTGEPIAPGIGWQDLRTVGDCIMARLEHGMAFAPNQSATKLSWILKNAATGVDASTLRFGTVETWLVWKLTHGESHVTDHTNAAVTGLTISTGTEWNDKALTLLNIPRECLPRIVPSAGMCGIATDLPGAPPIMALAGDQQASLVGQGCISPGLAKITFGTGGMLDMYTGHAAPSHAQRNSHGTFPIVSFSDKDSIHYGTEAIMLSAGTNIEWLRDDMGLISSAEESHTIASSVATTDGAVYVPALLGLGTPAWDYGARGAFFGITRGTTRAHLVRAVLEGVAHRGVDLIEAAEADSGIAISDIRIDGGMSRNPTFVQALADAAQRPVRVSKMTEATTLGAGFLAGTASGQWSHLSEASSTLSWAATVHPLGNPGVSRQQWSEAVSRSRSWIPDLSALDF